MPSSPTTASTRSPARASADNKDRWLVTRRRRDRARRACIDTLHDDAWIREAGVGRLGALRVPAATTSACWFLSERDGWMHLYTLDVDAPAAPKPTQLTQGKWEIADARAVAPTDEVLPHDAPRSHPGERHLYTVPVDGGARTQADVDDRRSNAAEVSPDDIDARRSSTRTAPSRPRCTSMPNRPGAPADAGHDDADATSGARSTGSIRR